MSTKQWFILLFTTATVTLLLSVARLIMGLIAKKRTAGQAEGRVCLSLILAAVSSILTAYTSAKLIWYAYLSLPQLENSVKLQDLFAVADYYRLIPYVISVISVYTFADYCHRKYGSKIRLAAVLLTVSASLLSFILTILVSRFTGTDDVLLRNSILIIPSILTITREIVFAATFIRNKTREKVFRGIYLFNFINILTIIIANVTTIMGSIFPIPDIAALITSSIISLVPVFYAIYILICVNRAGEDNEETEVKDKAIDLE